MPDVPGRPLANRPRLTVIDDVRVFDPVTGVIEDSRTIVIRGDRIEAVLDTGAALPGEAEVHETVDGRGLVALPGLIDSHTHLCFDGDPSRFNGVNPPGPVQGLLAAQAMRRHLDAGVTTVRDCGSPDGAALHVARAVEEGLVRGPEVLAAGRVLTMTGGHGHQVGVEIDGVDAATKATRAEIAAGADFIKVMSTGGIVTKGVTPEQAALQVEEIRAIVRAAHDAGRRVTAHATGLLGARNAVLAGVDSIEHGYQLDDEVVRMAAERGVMLVPTLVVPTSMTEHMDRLPSWMAEKIPPQRERQRASFKRAIGAGVGIAAGTDGGTPFNPHGSLHREIELMVEYGLTPAQALTAATLGSARNVGRDSEIGSLTAGKRADIVLVGGDPLADISQVRSVRRVYVRGAEHTPRPGP
ncbi:metal-dependent hydrolase family protein [Nonomuraea lactucae]|uniref:metal-dependent hydrolase family protein n=1 Tax=Nonomuraea lactucae TaxID=2249762 RepID=UPI0013B38225|nr:amidohydrolase family protein [Nonomuraea lactucae]